MRHHSGWGLQDNGRTLAPAQPDSWAIFKDASVHAKTLRKCVGAADTKFKVMFADNAQLAEDPLCQVREPGPSGDE